MKKILLTLAILSPFTLCSAREFSQSYSNPKEKTLSVKQFSGHWCCTTNGNNLSVPAANYTFANDYCHLQNYDSISYTYDSWKYMENGAWVEGTGAPLNITIKGWSEKGEIQMGQENFAHDLNGYYNGIELTTWDVQNTTINNLQFKLVAYGAAIESREAVDGVDTYVLTGNALFLPCKMSKDLRMLINETTDIRLDIRKMHNPKNLCLTLLINLFNQTDRTIRIVGGRIYNEYLGCRTKLIYEDDYEVVGPEPEPEPEPEPLMVDGEDFFIEEGFWADSITYNRKMSVNADSTKCMSSMILPFDVEASYLESLDADPYTVTSVASTSTKVARIYGTITANTPFLIKRTGNPKNTELSITVRDAYVPATPANLQNGHLVGVYQKMYLPNGCKVVQSGAIKRVVSDSLMITSFRAFILPTTDDYYTTYGSDNNAPSNNAPTAIDLFAEEEDEDTIELINILGQKASQATDGQLYIRNGKKYIKR